MTDSLHDKPAAKGRHHKHAPEQKFRMALSVAIGLAVFIFLIIRVFAPFSSDWRRQTTQIREKNGLIRQYEQLLEQEDSLRENFDLLSRQIQAEIPVEREESQFLTEIEKVASNTYVHVSTMNPLPIKDFGSFKELSVEIEMEANLGNLAKFLYDIKKSSVVLVANRLSLQPKSERSALLKGHLVISTIFAKDK
jgi:Tfp pilus assembly protein PilO